MSFLFSLLFVSLQAKAVDIPPYIVQPNDLLEIYVWKDPSLTRKVTVRPDGRISFPLIQDMQAAGLSPEAIKQEIEKKLKEYIEVPNVTVIVEAIQSYRVFVTGKVGKPGAIMAEKPYRYCRHWRLQEVFSISPIPPIW